LKPRVLVIAVALACAIAAACQQPPATSGAPVQGPSVDPQLASAIAGIRAVDNHTHVNSTAQTDTDFDALPIDGLPPFDLPARARPDSPEWIPAYRALYGYSYADATDAHLAALRQERARIATEQGDKFPEWVLDKVGIEVMFANRIAMGPGLSPPRFRWVSYVDALMLPLSTTAEGAVTPDRAKLYPLEEQLLKRYLGDLHLDRVPATLDLYTRDVVTATLARQRQAGCIGVKFEAAYLRALDFADAQADAASRVYARYASGGQPSHADYKTLQDYLFRYIARESGRLGMAVHIHSFEGAGSFFDASGADPLRLEPALNDPSLRGTKFVIVHGGGAFASHTGPLLWKPNVYADISGMSLIYSPARLAEILRDWLLVMPEKILFGSDASAFGPDQGWDIAAWVATNNARTALGLALTTMMRNGEATRERAQQLATMVLRTNAGTLYNLTLK
jgi:predicted TIM-barrel fold metal-dependent hydrolase